MQIEPTSLRSHTVGESVCVLPATEGLWVKTFCQPRIGGKWYKTAHALMPACMGLLETPCGPDLSPRLEGP